MGLKKGYLTQAIKSKDLKLYMGSEGNLFRFLLAQTMETPQPPDDIG